MTNDTPSQLAANKQALLKIRELKQQIAELQQQQSTVSEPIAIVSMACRFPKSSNTPEAFWKSLIDQTDEVSEIPEDRWDLPAFHDDDPEVPGKMYARHGVFLDNIDQMDPEFFGISPREATWVDPQQRLLMEVGWEALERAGWTPEAIGEHTGIFVGWMHNDYQNEASDSFLNLNPYIATGAAGSFLCGRLAYYLGLQGPSVAVDTACSSSLVALHLACQSLQQRDCDRALVGGVNAICSPTTNILTCKLKALSLTGQSRAFDAGADGYLRGEGCGVVTLRRLADAERDGDPILGVISGSAIGHNGFSSGLTAPNPKAQEKVIRQALERAQLSANDVSYLEAHGTGTELGDPIEMRAAATALASTRSQDEPLLVGSVKTNIGHLEAAAGMAGLIKVLLSLQNDRIPGQLNFEVPNPHIPWETSAVKVLTEPTAWPNVDQRVAGVSAFGMSGTNAHVVISGHTSGKPARQAASDQPAASRPELITLSGKSEEAVRDLAERYLQYVKQNDTVNLRDIAYTTNSRRSHFEHRAAVVASDLGIASEGLRAISKAASADFVATGQGRRSPKTAWQFTGQGSQYVGMAKGLYESEAVFRDAIDECNTWLSEWRNESLISVLFGKDYLHTDKQDTDKPNTDKPNEGKNSPEATIDHTNWTQPAIFAVQMGLAKLLASRDLQPDVVWGHSVGQYAAACVAGMMSWQDGLKLIAERGRLIGDLPAGGLMLAVFAPLQEVETELNASSGTHSVSIAALNGTHIVLSGDEAGIRQVAQRLADRSVRSKVLTTSHAFHSSLMDPALEPFAKFASDVEFQAGHIPLICNVSGKVLDADAVLEADYWAKHIREAVRFADCIDTAQEIGCEVILELGPQGVLTRMAAANWKKPADRLVTCIQKDGDDASSFLKAVSRMYTFGITPNFDSLYTGQDCQQILLPTYPFQRRRFWGPDKPRAAHAEHHTAHPLLGSHLKTPDAPSTKRYESFVDADSPSWVTDHQVMDQVVMPGAGFLELALAQGTENGVQDILFAQPLQLTGRTPLQTIVNRTTGSDTTIESYSLATDQKTWTTHFKAKLNTVGDRPANRDLAEIKKVCSEEIQASDFYAAMTDLGLQYGPAFQVIQTLHLSGDSVLTKLAVQGDTRGYQVPPPLLDGALHSLAAMLLKDSQSDLFLPVGIDQLVCFAPISEDVWCHASWGQQAEGEEGAVKQTGDVRFADLELLNDDGEVLLSITKLKVKKLDRAAMRRMSGGGTQRLIYGMKHEAYSLPGNPVKDTNWLLVADAHDSAADSVQQQLSDGGQTVVRCDIGRTADAMLESFIDDQRLHGIAWLPSDDTELNCTGLLDLVQTLKQKDIAELPCGLAIVTRGGSQVHDGTPNPLQTQYHGFARVLGAEHPEYRCRLIDFADNADRVDTEKTAENSKLGQVGQLLQVETRENEFVVNNDDIVVARLARIRGKQSFNAFEDWGDRSVLITGGLGSLGKEAAKWLVAKGVPHVVLISRRQPDEETQQQLKQIEEMGCTVVVHSADVTSKEQMEALVGEFGNSYPELGGVIHAAGVLDDGRIVDQTWERFAAVIATKIRGAELLDELTAEMRLRFFILYSSASSVFGTPGQSNYATGNAFLDGLAWRRVLSGKVGTSINWGPWDAGMAAGDQLRKRLALQGIRPLAIDEAHAAMDQILEQESVQATVIDADWRRMQMGLGAEAPPLLEDLVPARRSSQMSDSAFVGQLKRLRGAAQTELLVKTVQELLQTTLSTPDAPETDRPLIEMGLDSLMAVEFSTELQMVLGEQIPIGPTMLFDHPTIDAIAVHVLEMVSADEAEDKATAAPSAEAKSAASMTERESVAIVGMSCRFPGAQNLDEFWDNILNGVDSVREIPSDRWDIDRFYDADRAPGKMYTKQGGFLEDIGDFEPGFFNISAQEACWIDPQHRMLLENSYRALEHAGISPAPLADSNVGVYMGIMGQDYAFLPQLDDEEVIKGFQGAGLSHSAGVGRISYVFGFEGPCVAVDTASSSSLVALFQAVRSLQDHNCNMALAGGVNAILAPVNSLLMSKAGLLSPDGRCKSFSAAADGFGRGEGCGVVVLKRLSDAERDGDNVLAVVRGGAVVHNGFTSGITTPSGKAQARVITDALQDAGIAPSQVQYLEAHGTGTELGDPMELGAAAAVYGKGRKRDQPLLVGSVKGNISHLEAAGGVSGLIKTVLALHHGIIPPQANFDAPSSHIPWKRIPVKMVTETTEWPDAEERFAGVTALGLVGTNAHIVLSRSEPAERTKPAANDSSDEGPDKTSPAERSTHLLVLSARDEQRLPEVAKSYLDRVAALKTVDLGDFCYTAAVGRRHYEHRAAFTVNSVGQLTEQLNMFAQGKSSLEICKVKSQPKLAWVFADFRSVSGLSIHKAMQSVYGAEPVFRQFVAELDERLAVHFQQTKQTAFALKAWISSDADEADIQEIHLFALQAGLVHVWRAWGVEPDVVLGFGVGQYTSACVAGGLCFKDAATLILQRQIALTAIQDAPDNESALTDFEAFADVLNYYPPNMPLICSLNADVVAVHRTLGGSYWRQHLNDSLSSECWSCLETLNCDVIQQIGPESQDNAAQNAPWGEERPCVLPTFVDKLDISATMLATLGQLYVAGANPDFKAFDHHWPRTRIPLPHYPFHKKRYWITELSQHTTD